MKKQSPVRPVERLFSFVLRSRILMVGRDTLARIACHAHHDLPQSTSKSSATACNSPCSVPVSTMGSKSKLTGFKIILA